MSTPLNKTYDWKIEFIESKYDITQVFYRIQYDYEDDRIYHIYKYDTCKLTGSRMCDPGYYLPRFSYEELICSVFYDGRTVHKVDKKYLCYDCLDAMRFRLHDAFDVDANAGEWDPFTDKDFHLFKAVMDLKL